MRTFTHSALCFLIVLLFTQTTQAQVCSECRYASPIFDSVTVTTVNFGEGINSEGQNQVLAMDIYQPVGDTLASRPIVIFAFGGGFVQGTRTDSYVITACTRMAQAGYVAVSIDYRIGINPLGILDPTAELMRVFFRPMQDMRGAVQYMKASKAEMGDPYRVDTSMIILGGASAGAITALNVTYLDKDSEFAEIGSLSAISGLGGFNSSSGYYSSYTWSSQGVMNIAGALLNADWIEAGDPPFVSSHGDADNTVPYAGGNFNLGFAQLGFEGSFNLNQRAQEVGVCSYLHTIVGGGHPSGNASLAYLNNIFYRHLPRMKGIVEGKSFCCPIQIELGPEEVEVPSGAIEWPVANVSNSTNYNFIWCSDPCGVSYVSNQVEVPTADYPYVIAIVTEGNCTHSDFIYYTQNPDIIGLETELNNPITLYPNPNQGFFTLHGTENISGTWQIINTAGAVAHQFTVTEGATYFPIAVEQLPGGIYWVRHSNTGNTQRLVILR